MFADYVKVFTSISLDDDCIFLQDNSERICCWREINRFSLNVSKCNVMCFTRKKHSVQYDYKIAYSMIQRSIKIKNLGVNF